MLFTNYYYLATQNKMCSQTFIECFPLLVRLVPKYKPRQFGRGNMDLKSSKNAIYDLASKGNSMAKFQLILMTGAE